MTLASAVGKCCSGRYMVVLMVAVASVSLGAVAFVVDRGAIGSPLASPMR